MYYHPFICIILALSVSTGVHYEFIKPYNITILRIICLCSLAAGGTSWSLPLCQTTSVCDETIGVRLDKVILQTTGNNNLSSFPCQPSNATDMTCSKWNWCRKLPPVQFRKRWATRGPLPLTNTGRRPESGGLKRHLLEQSNKAAF